MQSYGIGVIRPHLPRGVERRKNEALNIQATCQKAKLLSDRDRIWIQSDFKSRI